MTVRRLSGRAVHKPWGRRDLPPPFPAVSQEQDPVGEIWFEDPDEHDPELLVKYLFTSEKLSIQVHPGDGVAREAGFRRGKDEAWLVVAAEPDAVIGLGLRERASPEELRTAVQDGSIEQLVDWRPVEAGDVLFSPAGTIHAIGPGLTVVEVQQNVDLTYRLYDYGRPRELHLDEALEAARLEPSAKGSPEVKIGSHRTLLGAGSFTMERWRGPVQATLTCRPACPLLLVPVRGTIRADDETLSAGSVWSVTGKAVLSLDGNAELLAAYPGAALNEAAFQLL